MNHPQGDTVTDTPLRALLIEDVESDAALVVRQLTKSGYEVDWERVECAGQMRAALEKRDWDVIIADYQLPAFNAPAALAILRQAGLDLPFLHDPPVGGLHAITHAFLVYIESDIVVDVHWVLLFEVSEAALESRPRQHCTLQENPSSSEALYIQTRRCNRGHKGRLAYGYGRRRRSVTLAGPTQRDVKFGGRGGGHRREPELDRKRTR